MKGNMEKNNKTPEVISFRKKWKKLEAKEDSGNEGWEMVQS